MKMLYAVLTGDIINSQKIDHLEKLLSELQSQFCRILAPTEWEIFRGDSFQIILPNIENCVEYVLIIKALVKKNKGGDVRIGMGIGSKKNQPETSTLAMNQGTAFIRSGRALDEIGKSTMKMASPWEEFDTECNIIFNLMGHIIDQWKQQSAEYVYLYLENRARTQIEIAEMLGITQGSVSERHRRSSLDDLLAVENWYKKRIHREMKKML